MAFARYDVATHPLAVAAARPQRPAHDRRHLRSALRLEEGPPDRGLHLTGPNYSKGEPLVETAYLAWRARGVHSTAWSKCAVGTKISAHAGQDPE